MFFVATLFLIAAALILCQFRPKLTVAHGIMAVIFTGSVLGHPFFNISIGGLPITIDRVLLAAVFGFAAYQWWQGKFKLTAINRIDILFVAFLIMLTLNVFGSDWKYRDNQPLAQLLFNYFVPFGIYLLARNLGNDSRYFKTLNFGLMALGGYLAFIAICEVKGWYGLIYPKFIISADETEFLGRGRGPFLNPVACGMYQMVAICCGMVWWTKANTRQKAALVAYAILMLTGIFCTLTRSVWLATGISLCVYVWFNCSRQWKGIFLVAAPIAAAALFGLAGDRLNSFKRDKEVTAEQMSESIELRPLLAIVATKMIADRPLLGHGLRQYSKHRAHFTTKDATDAPLQKVLPYVQHNLFLSYAVDLGLIGLAVYLTLFLSWWTLSLKLWLNRKLPWDVQQTGFLLLAFLIGFTVNGLFHDVSVIVMLHHLLFLLAGWVGSLNTYFFAAEPSVTVTSDASASENSNSVAYLGT